MFGLKYFREYYGIPKRYKLRWAVIVEQTKDGQKMRRMGILLEGTDKVIDVMNRKLIQQEILIPVVRKTYPATKQSDGEYVLFNAVDESIRIRKSEVDVEYFTSRYSPELMDTFVF